MRSGSWHVGKGKAREVRWAIIKDYYRDGEPFQDTWCILYGSESEALSAKVGLESGSDTSWYDSSDLDASAILYVDQVTL